MKAKKTERKAGAKQKIEKKEPPKRMIKAAPKKPAQKKPSNGNGNGNGNSGIRKQYLKGDMCSVTFKLPREAAPDAHVITVVGDFNDWNVSETPMKKLKTGDFTVTLKLPRGKEYRFRYFIDANRWENDWCADKYVPNAFGCDDSLVIV